MESFSLLNLDAILGEYDTFNKYGKYFYYRNALVVRLIFSVVSQVCTVNFPPFLSAYALNWHNVNWVMIAVTFFISDRR